MKFNKLLEIAYGDLAIDELMDIKDYYYDQDDFHTKSDFVNNHELIHFEDVLEEHEEINDMYLDSIADLNDFTPSQSIDYMIKELELGYVKIGDDFYLRRIENEY